MNYEFRPAIRENVGLLLGLAGGTGSGKTKSGMRLALGIAREKPFAVIDTEHGRAKHYAPRPGEKADGINTYAFHHLELHAPFRPDAYADAIKAADAAGYPVILVDSMSHEWAGEGGVLDWQDEELDDMVKRASQRHDSRPEWQIRESGKMAAWIKPKMAHKHMVQRLLQVKAHVILCFRAEEKVEMKKDDKGKFQIVPKQSLTGLNGWIPICEKNLPFELTASFLLTADAPGVPKPIKLQEQHRALFPLDKPITEESGRLIALWAAGGTPKQDAPSTRAPAETGSSPGAPASTDVLVQITTTLGFASETLKKRYAARLASAGAKKTEDLSGPDQQHALTWLKSQIDREAATTTTS